MLWVTTDLLFSIHHSRIQEISIIIIKTGLLDTFKQGVMHFFLLSKQKDGFLKKINVDSGESFKKRSQTLCLLQIHCYNAQQENPCRRNKLSMYREKCFPHVAQWNTSSLQVYQNVPNKKIIK